MAIDAQTVIAAVDRGQGRPCTACGTALLGHEIVVSMIAGREGSPACVDCLAAQCARERSEFLRHAVQHVRRLACFRAGWRAASAKLRSAGGWPNARIPAEIDALALAACSGEDEPEPLLPPPE
jgi:hypothetical protein